MLALALAVMPPGLPALLPVHEPRHEALRVERLRSISLRGSASSPRLRGELVRSQGTRTESRPLEGLGREILVAKVAVADRQIGQPSKRASHASEPRLVSCARPKAARLHNQQKRFNEIALNCAISECVHVIFVRYSLIGRLAKRASGLQQPRACRASDASCRPDFRSARFSAAHPSRPTRVVKRDNPSCRGHAEQHHCTPTGLQMEGLDARSEPSHAATPRRRREEFRVVEGLLASHRKVA